MNIINEFISDNDIIYDPRIKMIMQSRDTLPNRLEEGFSRPVESIMRCEDFKSNFARKLSNRYKSRSPICNPRQDITLKIRPTDNITDEVVPDNVQERIEPYSQLSKNSSKEHNGEVVKAPDKPISNSEISRIELTALNMELETLKWQLAQTEANRQMHIALIKQIVTFLNRVKEHIEYQREIDLRRPMSNKIMPRSFNCADLPRSRSVLQMNKSFDCCPTSAKNNNTRKISKSITDVNGYKESSSIWPSTKLNLKSESESKQKITEEITRLVTLANTVLSTKLPDLAYTCPDKIIDVKPPKLGIHTENAYLNRIEEDCTNDLLLDKVCDNAEVLNNVNNKFVQKENRSINSFTVTESQLDSGVNKGFTKLNTKEHYKNYINKNSIEKLTRSSTDIASDMNTPFVEDESGFSSLTSFQEIGIPIISVIPPSPCKEVGYIDVVQDDDINDKEKWKSDMAQIDKQAVKVFWV